MVSWLIVLGCTKEEPVTVTTDVAVNLATVATPTQVSPSDEIKAAKPGTQVTVHYHGTLDDGTTFDSSRQRTPLTFIVGSGQMIKGFDAAVDGMKLGAKTKVRLRPEEAYGEHSGDLIIQIPLGNLPEGVSIGQNLVSQTGGSFVVTAIDAGKATLDGNHPLAGKALTFEIEVVGIE